MIKTQFTKFLEEAGHGLFHCTSEDMLVFVASAWLPEHARIPSADH